MEDVEGLPEEAVVEVLEGAPRYRDLVGLHRTSINDNRAGWAAMAVAVAVPAEEEEGDTPTRDGVVVVVVRVEEAAVAEEETSASAVDPKRESKTTRHRHPTPCGTPRLEPTTP